MTLSRLNTLLLWCIILVNAYVILAPFYPEIMYDWQQHNSTQQHLQREINSQQSAAAPGVNTLIVPSMLLNQPILEGPVSKTYQILDQGIWRWPLSSTPDKGGNTVLIGHRFTYTNPRGVFYFLNKVAVGDQIAIYWQHREYIYKVNHIEQVVPTDISIEDNSRTAELTLFTCTPLWIPKDRLVVVANLEKTAQ
jgi:LPXTG-site transpeptidase (sortase) family protein